MSSSSLVSAAAAGASAILPEGAPYHVILGSFVHSLSLGDLQIIEDAALVYSPDTGVIHDIIPRDSKRIGTPGDRCCEDNEEGSEKDCEESSSSRYNYADIVANAKKVEDFSGKLIIPGL